MEVEVPAVLRQGVGLDIPLGAELDNQLEVVLDNPLGVGPDSQQEVELRIEVADK